MTTDAEERVARLLAGVVDEVPAEIVELLTQPEPELIVQPAVLEAAPQGKRTYMDLWQQARLLWVLKARPSQIPPADEDESWLSFLALGGRGAGKTRAGAEDISDFTFKTPDSRIALISATNDDVRDTMVEGDSGILSVVPAEALRGGSVTTGWNRSLMELYFATGARCKGFSAETPERLRGPQHHRAWMDEPSSWRHAIETWDMAMFGLRLGKSPKAIVTGTPKPTRLIKQLIASPTTYLARSTTFDNLDNLAPTFRAAILAKYEGTRLGRQELYAEVLEDAEGALWSQALFEVDGFYQSEPPDLERIVVAVDPSGSRTGDECGIIVAGVKGNEMWVLDDLSLQASPDVWARVVVKAYHDYQADRVVVERNFGGDMAQVLLHEVDRNVPVKDVNASRGKKVRAEPVAALYEQGRVHHARPFSELESEMTSWEPDVPGQPSPDRVDACLVGETEVLTQHGPMRIDEIQPGVNVWTRSGWKPVLHAWCSQRNAEVVSVQLSNGLSLTGTPDHRVWAEDRGWVALDALVWGDRLCGWTITPSMWTSMENVTSGTLKQRGDRDVSITPFREDLRESHNSIEQFTFTTLGRSLRDIMSITKMVTRSTMILQTLMRSLRKSMRKSTPLSSTISGVSGLSPSTIWPMNGIEVMKGAPGTESMEESLGRVESRDTIAFAPSAELDLRPSLIALMARESKDSVLAVAETDGPDTATGTNSRFHARSAEQSSGSPSTTRRNLAPTPARLSVAGNSLGLNERMDVYDITVEGAHEFVANGVIAHNCVWAATDLIHSYQGPVRIADVDRLMNARY